MRGGSALTEQITMVICLVGRCSFAICWSYAEDFSGGSPDMRVSS